MQGNILRECLQLPRSTPYEAMLLETGMSTMKGRIWYKKMMWYQNILKSDRERLVKKVVAEQTERDRKGTWYDGVKQMMTYYGIEDEANKIMKSEWKRSVKTKIRNKEEERMRQECEDKPKYRIVLQGKYEMKQYLKDLPIGTAKGILEARLLMIKVPGNYKSRDELGNCWLCGEGNEDMEHLYECKKTGELRNQWNTSKYDLLSDNTDELTRTSLFLSQVETLMEPKWLLLDCKEK